MQLRTKINIAFAVVWINMIATFTLIFLAGTGSAIPEWILVSAIAYNIGYAIGITILSLRALSKAEV